MLIDLFIQAGWYTVPLKGKLERTATGDKTLPVFEMDWRKKYSSEFNVHKSRLAGAISGKKSGFIAVDCDNQVTYDLFRGLDPENDFHFVSKGKPTGGGTIIYAYTEEVGGFKLTTESIRLDFYSDEGFVYLPTEDNRTKESWSGKTSLPELRPIPDTVLAVLKTFKLKTAAAGVVAKGQDTRHTISNRLAPMLETFVKSKKYDPILFKVITPRAFRDLPSYVSKGHLHPDDVPRGRGSEYLSKVSAVLGADISVNVELYTNSMMLLFELGERFKHWDKKKLMKTVIEPMIEGRSSVDGQVIWQYDQHWEKMGFIATSTNGDYLESFYDDVKGIYYLINYTVPYVRTFSDKRPVMTVLKTLLGRAITEMQYDSTKQIIRTHLNPAVEFGHVEGSDEFNLFRQTQELSVLNDPSGYKDQYVRPECTIRFFESFIPDDRMRAYVLSFIRTKMTTFKYSPVILYFIGKPGSGKDTFVEILRRILSPEYVSKPDTKVFLEQYNGWMIDKYVVQLDEYGNKLVRASDKQEVLGKLKAYTGSSEMQVRAMRADGFNYRHSITFVLTANSNPLPLEVDDRRVCFASTPNKLKDQDWVLEAGGISHVQEQIKRETMDFCYYLGTEVNSLSSDDYVFPPETADKDDLILNSLPAVDQLVLFAQNNRWDEMLTLADEYGVEDFHRGWEKNRLDDEKVAELYQAMTDGAGVHRTIIHKLKGIGVHRQHTTRMGSNAFYYQIEGLNRFKPSTGGDGGPVSFDKSGIKGL